MLANASNFMLWHGLAISLLVVSLGGIVLGLLDIFQSKRVASISGFLNRWISARWLLRFLDQSISIEHWFYRHHRSFGVSAILGAAYILCYFGLLFDKQFTLQRLSIHLPPQFLEGMLDALVLFCMTGAVVALLVGLFLLLRPSMLRGIEEDANRWISLRRATKVLDIPRDQFDSFVLRHQQRVGWLLLLGSIYLFFIILRGLLCCI